MGAGKTAIGRQLALRLNRGFHDTDLEIQQRTGVELALVFELEGEEGFRRREQSILKELLELDGVIIATGGGTVLDAANRSLLRERALVIYLETSVRVQAARTQRTGHRPLLAGANRNERESKLTELFEERKSLYEQLAHCRVNTDHKHVRAVASEIVQLLEARSGGALE